MGISNFHYPDVIVVCLICLLLFTCIGLLFTSLSFWGAVYGLIVGIIINCLVTLVVMIG